MVERFVWYLVSLFCRGFSALVEHIRAHSIVVDILYLVEHIRATFMLRQQIHYACDNLEAMPGSKFMSLLCAGSSLWIIEYFNFPCSRGEFWSDLTGVLCLGMVGAVLWAFAIVVTITCAYELYIHDLNVYHFETLLCRHVVHFSKRCLHVLLLHIYVPLTFFIVIIFFYVNLCDPVNERAVDSGPVNARTLNDMTPLWTPGQVVLISAMLFKNRFSWRFPLLL